MLIITGPAVAPIGVHDEPASTPKLRAHHSTFPGMAVPNDRANGIRITVDGPADRNAVRKRPTSSRATAMRNVFPPEPSRMLLARLSRAPVDSTAPAIT